MTPRFTARARSVIHLADREAQRFSHEYIGTEHILLALLREGGGVGCDVLRGAGIDLRRVDREVAAVVQYGTDGDHLNLPRRPQTPRARRVIEYAIEEAAGLKHAMVGTGDLLLGLVREDQGVGAQVLAGLGLGSSVQQLNDLRSRVAAEQARVDDDHPQRPAVDLSAPEPTLGPPPMQTCDPNGIVKRQPPERIPDERSMPSLGWLAVCGVVLLLGVGTFALLDGHFVGVLVLIVSVTFCIATTTMPKRQPRRREEDGIDPEELRRLVEQAITAKFGPIDTARRQQIQQWDEGRLAEARRRLGDAKTLDDLM